jgi:sulfonate transport system substrate-binding protein
LVPKGSPIHSVKDLKGKKIAVAKGSSAYNTLYQALSQNGLTASDVNIVQLQPNDAEPAFNGKKVDAWSIWDPFTQVETMQQGATILTDDAKLGLVPDGFTFVRSAFAAEHPDLVVLFLKTYQQAVNWELSHLDEATSLLANERHLDKNVVRAVLTDGKPEMDPITPDIVKQQQDTADFLYKNGGVPKQIDVSKVVDNSFIDQVIKK